MKKNNKTVDIDFAKLTEELKKRGKTFRAASEEMGFSRSYLSAMRCEGHLPQRTMVALKGVYGITEDEIKLVAPVAEPEPEVEEPEVEVTGIDMAALQKCITEAVKDAFVWYANN